MASDGAAHRNDVARPEIPRFEQNVMRHAHDDRAAANRFVIDAHRPLGAKSVRRWKRERDRRPLANFSADDAGAVGLDAHFLWRDAVQKRKSRGAARSVGAKLSAAAVIV